MRLGRLHILLPAVLCLVLPGMAAAATVSAYYGDDDGFGIGETSGIFSDPLFSHNTAGDAPLTDMSLISNNTWACSQPDGTCGPFNPTGSFSAFAVSGTITSATLTLRVGSFDSAPPLDGPNKIYLDGMLVDPAFINSFSSVDDHDLIETLSINLDAAFFPLLADGNVSLAGTYLSEASGSHRFQVDFLRLDIQSTVIPLPAAAWLFGSGLMAMGWVARRRSGQ